jgi:GNAT superfamily N-acetyltransferase
MHPVELGELAAFRDFYLAAPEETGFVVDEIDGATCLALPAFPGSALFNRVLGLGLARPASKETVDRIAALYERLGTEWCVSLAPQAKPPEVASWLEGRGLATGYGWAKFARGAADPPRPATELRVEAVGAAKADAFADAIIRGYGIPAGFHDSLARLPGRDGWRCFVAFDGDEPAGAGALFVTGAVGWLGMAGTVPEHRRRGAQGAILAARIEEAAAAGCQTVVTETGELLEGRPSSSYRNILRAGFEPAYVRANYLTSSEADTSGTSPR